MKRHITFVSAGAGSGKTHRITEVIASHLSNGSCRPDGLIATTYTVKAANELCERVRQSLYSSGNPALGERLHESLIGTVHGICGQLLERFAFEAGISPRIEILSEEDAASLSIQAIETVVEFDELNRLQLLGDVLGQKEPRTFQYSWKRQIRKLLDSARANDFSADSLASMAAQSVDELLGFLPTPATDDLDARLAVAIRSALECISAIGDETRTTSEYLELLRDSLRGLESHRLPWSEWIKLGKRRPAKKCQAHSDPLVAVASRVESHPRLRADLREYTSLLFSVARDSLTEFQRLKEELGLLDFSDLEHRAFRLLHDHEGVRQTLGRELDLLVVDEFQDTSPLQLALFTQLAALARETVWVGDVKQAIYGFRNSDPDLIQAVIEQIRTAGTLAEPLSRSWRATPDLVNLCNALFVPAFESALGLPAKEVKLQSQRAPISPPQPVVEFFELSSGQFNKKDGAPKALTKKEYAATLAEGIDRLLCGGDKLLVQDAKSKKHLRPAKPRDVAVLCRTNQAAARLAEKLVRKGRAVALSQAGLMATPEARLALACLRRLADPTDSLASAEIVSLSATMQPEEWLENRLRYVAKARQDADRIMNDRWAMEGDLVHPAIIALEQARGRLNVLSPVEALDAALHHGEVFATVSAWGSTVVRASQRRANLEALRAIAVKFEQASVKNHTPATIAGLLFWCDFLAGSEADFKATDDQVEAVHVGTYHQAKGLEWPIVICADLDSEPRPRLWEVTADAIDPQEPFNLDEPLANRRLRFWPWPFGQQKSAIPMRANVESGEFGQIARRKAEDEELRLLYVGLTRARDLLVLVREKDRPAESLDCLQAPWLQPGNDPLVLPDQTSIAAQTTQLTPSDDLDVQDPNPAYAWFPAPLNPTDKPPARLTPSAQHQRLGSRIGQIIEVGPRLPFTGKIEEADLGDAFHAILAAEFVNPDYPRKLETISRILRNHDLHDHIQGEDVLQMVERFKARLQNLFQPLEVLVEVPFAVANDNGQLVEGFMDMLLKTRNGWILIDHKTYPGKRNQWADEAVSYSGQLALYRESLNQLNWPVCGTWIHFAVGGGLAKVILGDAAPQQEMKPAAGEGNLANMSPTKD